MRLLALEQPVKQNLPALEFARGAGMSVRLLLATVCLVTVTPVAAERAAEGIAAIVNSNVITFSEVRRYVEPLVPELNRRYSGAELQERIRAAMRDALEHLIDRRLILDEFHAKGYSIPDNFVEQEINREIESKFEGDRARFIKTLQEQKLTYSQYREQVRERLIVQAMRARKTQATPVVSPHRIEEYYKQHIDDYKVKDQAKLRMIYVKKTGSDDDARRAFAESLLTKLDQGAKFEELARQYSEDPAAQRGGERDWIARDTLQKELNDAAFNLRPGQHSRVVETKDGFFIVKMDDFKPAHTKPLAEVRESIEKILSQEQSTRAFEEWIRELRAKAFIRYF
ncbi:MAG: peptidylprolyl isomerase [Verrucomicrobiae bacterium]|nr:peptidylprolyl isomerase [Verrucomicrobiae bacterium]